MAAALSLQARGRVEVELHDDLAADEPLPLALVRTLAGEGTDALLVGHQPAVEELVQRLAAPAKVPLPGWISAPRSSSPSIGSPPTDGTPAAVLDPYAGRKARIRSVLEPFSGPGAGRPGKALRTWAKTS